MMNLDKLDAVIHSPAYIAYSELIGAAIGRAALGDPFARQDILELQQEQQELVRQALES